MFRNCKLCKKDKTLKDFHKNGNTNGIQLYKNICKECYKSYEKRFDNKRVELHRQKYPDKARARVLVQQAVRSGKIVKPNYCTTCGVLLPKNKILGHHSDYSKPLKVGWFCHQCHTDIHAFLSKRLK